MTDTLTQGYTPPSVMTPAEVAALAYAAGITNMNDLVTATAIPARESSYVPSKHNLNPQTQDDSWGLWQIDVQTNPTLLQQLGLSNASDLQNPYNNAVAMAALYKSAGNTFNAWGPYKGLSPTYGISPQELSAAQAGVMQAQSQGWLTPAYADNLRKAAAQFGSISQGVSAAGNTVSGIVGAFSDIPHALQAVWSAITNPTNWKHILEVIGGGWLVILGLYLMASSLGMAPKASGIVKAAAFKGMK